MTTCNWTTVTAADGHVLNAFEAIPARSPRGGLVVIQEIFGVNAHVRAVAAQFAGAGYAVLAPALFDRAERGVDLGYDADGAGKGRALRAQIGWDGPVQDVGACLQVLAPHGGVGTVGYCWGGSVSFLAATRIRPDAAVCYYGGQIAQFRDERPVCPVLMHFGQTDTHIPETDVAKIRDARPEAEIHLYPAGHGFNCTERADYHADSAALALDRTLAFLARAVG